MSSMLPTLYDTSFCPPPRGLRHPSAPERCHPKVAQVPRRALVKVSYGGEHYADRAERFWRHRSSCAASSGFLQTFLVLIIVIISVQF